MYSSRLAVIYGSLVVDLISLGLAMEFGTPGVYKEGEREIERACRSVTEAGGVVIELLH